MKGLLGIKLGMSQIIQDDGTATPVTIMQAGPCFVTQVKTEENDGYSAIQVGFLEVRDSKLNRPKKGHLGLLKKGKKSAGIPAIKHLREFRLDDSSEYKVGQTLTVEQFEVGDVVDVTGKSKGRGFTGVVKRHGFGGGPKTHGQSDRWRAPGSIGSTSSVGRVFKGTRMAGRFGNERKTVQNLVVVQIDADKNLIAISGAAPGVKGGLILIRDAVKSRA